MTTALAHSDGYYPMIFTRGRDVNGDRRIFPRYCTITVWFRLDIEASQLRGESPRLNSSNSPTYCVFDFDVQESWMK